MSTQTTFPKATFAAGCFWGTQHMYLKQFGNALIETQVGYIGGDINNPNYKQVCTGETGHAEAIEIKFDSNKITYQDLTNFFFRMHDPTTLNSQGPDKGTQYKSAIFYHDENQKEIAENSAKLSHEIYWKNHSLKNIVTQIIPAGKFYTAEEYHQKYLLKNPNGYECPSHRIYY